MEDRLVQYPNRVRLVQVDGQPGVYDIEAVPGTVTANGTPLNKATLLSDAVATLVNNAATPNEALKYLAERVQPVRLGGTGASTVEGILANLDIDDYVVEQGTSGIWTYRKWNSGIAECWTYWIAQNGSGKRKTLEIQLPFAFASKEYNVVVSLGNNGSTVSGVFGDFDGAANRQHTTTSFKFSWIGSETYSVGFYFDVKGRWK